MSKSKNKKNIIVYALTERRGGIESFFINYLPYLKGIHLDFIKLTSKKLSYEEKLINNNIYYIPRWRDDPVLRQKKIRKILHSKNYDALWFNSNDLASIDIIREAKKMGIKCIGHAHNSRTNNLNRTIRHSINKVLISSDFDGKFACSISAAKWFYPNYKDSVIIYNAIDINNYLFDAKLRKKIRDKYNIPKDFIVLGSIGRLEKQKNISYLINIFEQYHKKNSKSFLMIVGTGSRKNQLKRFVAEKKLTSSVIFTGEVSNTSKYLSAFDTFLMPSLYEGLPVTLVEAQAAGLNCIVADNITREVDITKNINYYPIGNKDINLWVKSIVKSSNRINEGKKMIGTVFDISKSASKLEKEILEVVN